MTIRIAGNYNFQAEAEAKEVVDLQSTTSLFTEFAALACYRKLASPYSASLRFAMLGS